MILSDADCGLQVGLNIRKVNMEVGLNPEDEERMEESIFPSGMLQHVSDCSLRCSFISR